MMLPRRNSQLQLFCFVLGKKQQWRSYVQLSSSHGALLWRGFCERSFSLSFEKGEKQHDKAPPEF